MRMDQAMRFGWLLWLLALVAGASAQEVAPQISVKWAKTSVAAGETVDGTVTFSMAPSFHVYQNPPTESWMIPITLSAGTEGFTLDQVRYPKGEDKIVGGLPDPAAVHSGTLTIPVRLRVSAAAGSHEPAIKVRFQQCDDSNCYIPKTVEVKAPLTVTAASNPTQPTGGGLQGPATNPNVDPAGPPAEGSEPNQDPDTPVSSDDPVQAPVEPDPNAGQVQGPRGGGGGAESAMSLPPGTNPLGYEDDGGPSAVELAMQGEQSDTLSGRAAEMIQQGNWLPVLGLMVAIGLLINLTPCVYPMVPVTLSFFSSQSAENRGARVGLGLMYMLGMAITFGLVGGIAAASGAVFGQLFTQPWFNILLAAIMIGLALSMFGVYEIRLPAFIGRQLKGRSGPVGSLIMGLLIGFAAAPCAGPLIAPVFTEVAKLQNIAVGVVLFTVIGLGLGIPYVFLAAASSGASTLPRAGGWMKTVKAVLGLVVVGVGVYYLLLGLGPAFAESHGPLVWIGFAVLATLYLLFLENGGLTKAVFGIKGAAILALGAMAGTMYAEYRQSQFEEALGDTAAREIVWEKWTPESWEAALASGKPILVDGTANWCAECRTIERNVWSQPEAIKASREVITLKIDWSTGVDDAYIKETGDKFGIKGLPWIGVFKPGGTPSASLNHLESTEELKKYLNQAGANL